MESDRHVARAVHVSGLRRTQAAQLAAYNLKLRATGSSTVSCRYEKPTPNQPPHTGSHHDSHPHNPPRQSPLVPNRAIDAPKITNFECVSTSHMYRMASTTARLGPTATDWDSELRVRLMDHDHGQKVRRTYPGGDSNSDSRAWAVAELPRDW